MATSLGHLDQKRSNLQSTKKDNNIEDTILVQIPNKKRDCFYTMIELTISKTAYTNQTGRFPCQSSRVNTYMFVCYKYDANSILVEAIKNKETDYIIYAWDNLHKYFTKNGHEIIKYILDNECSASFKMNLMEAKLDFELVRPH